MKVVVTYAVQKEVELPNAIFKADFRRTDKYHDSVYWLKDDILDKIESGEISLEKMCGVDDIPGLLGVYCMEDMHKEIIFEA